MALQQQQKAPSPAPALGGESSVQTPQTAQAASTTSTAAAGPGLAATMDLAASHASFEAAVRAGDGAAALAAWGGLGPDEQAAFGTDRGIMALIRALPPETGNPLLTAMGFEAPAAQAQAPVAQGPAPVATPKPATDPDKPANPEAKRAAPALEDVRAGTRMVRGDYGASVAVIQGMVNAPVTRVFDEATEKAVKAWQAKNHIQQTGAVGPTTLGKLMPARGNNKLMIGIGPGNGGYALDSGNDAGNRVANVEKDAGRPMDIIQTYRSLGAPAATVTGDLDRIFKHGSIAHLNIEPYSHGTGEARQTKREDYTDPKLVADRAHLTALYEKKAAGTLTKEQEAELPALRDRLTGRNADGSEKAGGGSDLLLDRIRDMGDGIKKALDANPKGAMIITLGAEMDGGWLAPKGEGEGAGKLWGLLSGQQYQSLYKAGHQIISECVGDAKGRVKWAWGPDSGASSIKAGAGLKAYFPGLDYTDYIGSSSYRHDEKNSSAAPLFGELDAMQKTLGLSAEQAKGRMMILQTGSHRAGDDSRWTNDLITRSTNDERIAGLIWFDQDGATDNRKWIMDEGTQAMLGDAQRTSGGASLQSTKEADASARGRQADD